MRRLIFVALSIVLLPRLVNAEEAGSNIPQPEAQDQTLMSATVTDVVNTMLGAGGDRVDFKDQRAPLLGFKEKTGMRNRGGEVSRKKTPDGATRSCHIALKETKKGLQPQCLIITWLKEYPEEKSSVEYVFRFDLAGKLEKAFRGVGKNTETGNPIEGSAVNTPLKIKDFEVQQRAREELEFWLKRTAKHLAKKRGSTEVARDAVAEPTPAPAKP